MERIGAAVRSELGRFGTAGAMADLVAAWPQAVGDAVAANAWPARLARDGTLHVATSSSTWAFELGQLSTQILEKLGDAAPPRLRFAPGPLPEPPRPAAAEAAREALCASPEDDRAAAELVAGI